MIEPLQNQIPQQHTPQDMLMNAQIPVMSKAHTIPASGSTDFPIKSNPYFPGGSGNQ